MTLQVRPTTLSRLFEFLNDVAPPGVAADACRELTDAEVAEFLDLYLQTLRAGGDDVPAFIETASERLRRSGGPPLASLPEQVFAVANG